MKSSSVCKSGMCRFTAIGSLRVVHIRRNVAHLFGLCAVHRDQVVKNAIDDPSIGKVDWFPRTDWANDGAAA